MKKTCLFKYKLPRAIQEAGFTHLDNVSETFFPPNFHLKQDDCFPPETFNKSKTLYESVQHGSAEQFTIF